MNTLDNFVNEVGFVVTQSLLLVAFPTKRQIIGKGVFVYAFSGGSIAFPATFVAL